MLHECKLLANRYIEFNEQFWDARMLYLQNFKSIKELNEAVDAIIDQLKAEKGYKAGWLPTLGIHMANWDKLDEQWKVILQPKIHLLIFDSAWSIDKYWLTAHVYREVTFISVPKSGVEPNKWKVYTQLDGNGLNYRYKQVSKAVVEKAIAEQAITPTSSSTPSTISTDACNITITSNNLTITIQTKGDPDNE